MKKPNTPPVSNVQGTKLAPADWHDAFSGIDFCTLDSYAVSYLEQVIKDSWSWYMDHQLCLKFEDVERYTRAVRAIRNHISRRL